MSFSHPPGIPSLPTHSRSSTCHASSMCPTARPTLRCTRRRSLRHPSKAQFEELFFHRQLAAEQNSEGQAVLVHLETRAEPAPRITDGREDDEHAPSIFQ